MTVRELAEKHGLSAVCLPNPDKSVSGCYTGDLLSWVMGRAQASNVWITIMSNINIAAVASLADLSAVILAEGVKPDDGVCEAAASKGVNILSSALPAFETAVAIAYDV